MPPEATERTHQLISQTVKRLQASIPTFSYFLYNYNFNDINGKPAKDNGATSHCCLWVPEFMRFKREGYTGIDWIKAVMEGKTVQIGKDLIV